VHLAEVQPPTSRRRRTCFLNVQLAAHLDSDVSGRHRLLVGEVLERVLQVLIPVRRICSKTQQCSASTKHSIELDFFGLAARCVRAAPPAQATACERVGEMGKGNL